MTTRTPSAPASSKGSAAQHPGQTLANGTELRIGDLSPAQLIELIREAQSPGSILNDTAAQAALMRMTKMEASQVITNYRQALGDACAYLDDKTTVEIYKNALDKNIWIINGQGKRQRTEIDQKAIDTDLLIGTIARANGLEATHHSPHVETVLPYNGARFTATLPPLVASPMWAIRKRISKRVELISYINSKTLQAPEYEALDSVIQSGKPIVIVGPQRVGKTTFANAVLAHAAKLFPDSRFGIAEDVPEIQCPAPDRYELLTSRHHGIKYQHLIKMALRYGADSFSLGELREEPSALFDAWSTGTWVTGVTTVHGKTLAEGVNRLRTMYRAEMNGTDLDPEILKDTVGAFVVLAHAPNGQRRITDVARIKNFTSGGFDFTNRF